MSSPFSLVKAVVSLSPIILFRLFNILYFHFRVSGLIFIYQRRDCGLVFPKRPHQTISPEEVAALFPLKNEINESENNQNKNYEKKGLGKTFFGGWGHNQTRVCCLRNGRNFLGIISNWPEGVNLVRHILFLMVSYL